MRGGASVADVAGALGVSEQAVLALETTALAELRRRCASGMREYAA